MSNPNDEIKARKSGRFWEQLSALLTTIGLWLALPTICGLLQRIVDSIGDLQMISRNAFTITKIVLDTCLLGMYLFGLALLITVGVSAVLAAQAVSMADRAIFKAREKSGIWGAIKSFVGVLSLKKIKTFLLEIWLGKRPEIKRKRASALQKNNPNQ